MTYCYSCGLVSPEPPQTGYNQAVFNSWHEAVPERLLESREKHAHAYFQRQGYLCYTLSNWVCPWVCIFGSHGVCLAHLVLQKRANSIQPSCVGYDFKSNTMSPWLPVKITMTSRACFSATECELGRLLQEGQGEASYLQALQGEVLST